MEIAKPLPLLQDAAFRVRVYCEAKYISLRPIRNSLELVYSGVHATVHLKSERIRAIQDPPWHLRSALQ